MDIILLAILINILKFHLIESDGFSIQSEISGLILSEKIRGEYLFIFLFPCQGCKFSPKIIFIFK